VPLSEEEQRILHEMEQSLYEQDRAFVDRVRSETPRALANRSLRWSVLAFAAGFAVLLLTFRSSLLLGTCGFLVMLSASFLVERSLRQDRGTRAGNPADSARSLSGELTVLRRRAAARLRRRR
jgi:hypothetical protein